MRRTRYINSKVPRIASRVIKRNGKWIAIPWRKFVKSRNYRFGCRWTNLDINVLLDRRITEDYMESRRYVLANS